MHELREITCVCIDTGFFVSFVGFITSFKFPVSYLDSHIVTWSSSVSDIIVLAGHELLLEGKYSHVAILVYISIQEHQTLFSGRMEFAYMDPWTS